MVSSDKRLVQALEDIEELKKRVAVLEEWKSLHAAEVSSLKKFVEEHIMMQGLP